MLDERKQKMIDLILQGYSKSDIAKLLSVARPTVYEWLKDNEIIEQLKIQRQELKYNGAKKITGRLDSYLEVLYNLATTSTDKRVALSAAIYLTDRALLGYEKK